MEGKELAIVKLGGSLITYKDNPLSVNLEALDVICNALSKSDIISILVHGGGSFGHYFAQKYGLTPKPSKISAEGVTRTKTAMLMLNLKIINHLVKYGINPYSLPPSNFIEHSVLSQRKIFFSLINYGFIPITYGDVLSRKGGFFVLSGDEITRILSKALKPRRVVFLLDVDGIFEDINQPDSLIKELKPEALPKIRLKNVDFDVTGGMMLKLKEAIKIARNDIDVSFINGKNSDIIIKALRGEQIKGTLIRGNLHG